MKSNKGFTLIELLVVIAIIGILSSVVLASLNTARDKGSDAAIKANIGGIRAQAELYYDGDGDGSYVNMCTNDPQVSAALAAADENNGEALSVSCTGTSDAWQASAELKSGGQYCVDSLGYAGDPGALPDTGVDTGCVND